MKSTLVHIPPQLGGPLKFMVTDEMIETAADLCALMASTDGEWFGAATLALGLEFEPVASEDANDVLDSARFGLLHPSAYLARAALWSVRGEYMKAGTFIPEGGKVRWAEAEAMLRDGWTP